LLNVQGLATKLAAQADPVSSFVWSNLSISTQQVLTNPVANPDAQRYDLTSDLNLLLIDGPLYSTQRFANVNLSTETRVLLPINPQGPDQVRLNRLLLEDAYPNLIVRSPSIPSGRMRLAAAYDSQRHAVVTMAGFMIPAPQR
jgi:hypothetical protein